MPGKINLQLSPRRPVPHPRLAVHHPIHGVGVPVPDRAAHDAHALDVADEVRVRLEQPRGVGQAARGNDPGGPRPLGTQGGGGGVDGGRVVRARADEGFGQQRGAVEARLAVDVFGVAGEVGPRERGGGALVEGDAVVLADGGQDAGGVPGRLSI